VQWERVQFSDSAVTRTLEMSDLFNPEDVSACASLFESAASPSAALAAWTTRKDT
jgi:hypothetical protein